MAESVRTCVVIPAFNEEERVGEVVRGVRGWAERILVVDDGSEDATADRAREAGAEIVVHPKNRGKGAALMTGFERARELGCEWVIVMDADGQHDPSDIPALLERQKLTGADVVIGTRMGNPTGMPLIRRWTNRFTSAVISWLIGQRVPDSQSGFRLYRTAILDGIRLTTSNYDAESEILIQLARRGARIESAPIRSIYGDQQSRIRPGRDTVRFFRLVGRYRKADRNG